jgi:hypothetical protein
MLYRISNKQTRTSRNTGKQYVSADLTDMNGQLYQGVSAFNGEFDNTDNWEGELVKNGQYWNMQRVQRTQPSTFQRKDPMAIEAVRNQHIKENMDEKSKDIAWFNSRNTAIVFVEKFGGIPFTNTEEALGQIRQYTDVFYQDFLDWKNSPPF